MRRFCSKAEFNPPRWPEPGAGEDEEEVIIPMVAEVGGEARGEVFEGLWAAWCMGLCLLRTV